MKLEAWKIAPANDHGFKEIKDGQISLTELWHSRTDIKRSGYKFEQFCRESNNGYVARSKECLSNVDYSNRKMQCYLPVHNFKKENPNGGHKNLLTGDGRNHPCYHCGRCRHECSGSKNFKLDTKEDGSSVNVQKVIAQKFMEMKEVVIRSNNGGRIEGTGHAMERTVLQSWTDVIDDENPHDFNLH